MKALTLSLVACAMIVSACATSRPAYDARYAYKTVHSSPTTLTRTELSAQAPGRNLYDVIRAVRPQFLRYHGTVPTIAINGMLVGGPSVLTTIDPQHVKSIQMIGASDATIRFGPRTSGAVMLVELGAP
jgi:hypothetical protein